MIANKDIHTAAQSCITCWILIIPILQGKRLLPCIIAEKTSQRNQNSNVFICPSFRAFLLLFCRVPKRCIFYGKCHFIDIWHACPELKQKLSISDYNVIILFYVRTIIIVEIVIRSLCFEFTPN